MQSNNDLLTTVTRSNRLVNVNDAFALAFTRAIIFEASALVILPTGMLGASELLRIFAYGRLSAESYLRKSLHYTRGILSLLLQLPNYIDQQWCMHLVWCKKIR